MQFLVKESVSYLGPEWIHSSKELLRFASYSFNSISALISDVSLWVYNLY